MDQQRFDFAFAGSYRLPALLLGITPWTSHVDVDGTRLHVRFGPWSLTTPVANVASVAESSDFSWHRTAGPPRLSLSDHGVSFATNGDRAVCLELHQPVPVLDPTGRLLRHPGVTLTVTDVEGLAARLRPAPGS